MDFKEIIDSINEEIKSRQGTVDTLTAEAKSLKEKADDATAKRSKEETEKLLSDSKDVSEKLLAARSALEESNKKKSDAIAKHDEDMKEAERNAKPVENNGGKNMPNEIMEQRGKLLKESHRYEIPPEESRSLLLSDTIAKPGTSSTSAQGFKMPKLLELVWLDANHSGYGQEEVDYIRVLGTAGAGAPGTTAQASEDTHGKVRIMPSLIKRTSLVDSHIKDQTNVNYAETTMNTAMYSVEKALSAACALASTTAVDTESNQMYAAKTVAAIDQNFITTLDIDLDPVGDPAGEPTLLLNRNNLKTIGSIRGTNEKKKVFDIIYDAGTRDSGRIVDGGTVINFCVEPSFADNKMVYGYLKALKVDLFAPVTVSSDESEHFSDDLISIKAETQAGAGIIFYHAINVITVGA